jgi:molybdate transport system ATP-binding protein
MKRRLDISLHAVSVQRGGRWVLQDVSLELHAGARWALVGANGAGKTQLLKLLAADIWPTPTGRERRVYRIGRRVLDLTEAKRRIAYLGAERQDQYSRYGWDLAVRDVIATGLHRSDLLLSRVSRAARARVDAALETGGLAGLAPRRFLSLSYGQKRLVLLARALVQQPDWLLLDECYNGLDARYRRRMNAILKTLRKRGQSWIVAAHRTMDVPPGTTCLMELNGGRLSAVRPLDRTSLARLERSAGETRRRNAPRPCATDGRLLLRLAHCDLYVDYRLVLRDVNFELRRGQHWAVTGANGAGKSSLLKLLYGDLLPALGGVIERPGFPAGAPIERWKRRTAYLSPELQTDYLVDVPVADLVMSGRYGSIGLAEAPTPTDRRVAARWLRFFGLQALAERRPRELSYGQLRRALMARALAAHAKIILLDEPLTGLDPGQRALMKALLEELANAGVTLVIAAHHLEDLPCSITHVLRLHKQHAQCAAFHFADGVGGTQRR